jgi:ribosome-associated protein
MSAAVTFTDWFVILSGATARQTKAIADEIQHGLRQHGVRAARTEGERQGDWILLDYLDVVIHVFTPAAREFYRLETLWGDVPQTRIDDDVSDQEARAGLLRAEG